MQFQYTWGWPNIPGCQLTTAARDTSENGADVAAILKRDCDKGDHINYFLRLDIGSSRPGPWGGRTTVALENDQYPVGDPTVVWIEKNKVQVTVRTKTLSGTLVEKNQSPEIEIFIVYKPGESVALPNNR